MNATASTLGLTLLVAALVVGMEQHREHQEGQQACERTKEWTQSHPDFSRHPNEREKPSSFSNREKFRGPTFLSKSEQSRVHNTLSLAHERLQREHDHLHLSKQQRLAIFPLLVRSEIDYDPELRYPLGRHGRFLSLGKSLSRADYDSLLSPLLTPEQEEERETQNGENEAWWSHIIGRLEEDLNQQTEVAPAPETISIPLPEEAPLPPAPAPTPHPEPTETEAVAPSRNSLRGSRNLLDLLGS